MYIILGQVISETIVKNCVFIKGNFPQKIPRQTPAVCLDFFIGITKLLFLPNVDIHRGLKKLHVFSCKFTDISDLAE